MLSMKKHKLPKVILGICIISLLGFKYTGIFVDEKESKHSSTSLSINKVVQSAYEKLGSRYVYDDIGRKGYDCSGLTYSIYLNELGIELNRNSIDQAKNGLQIDKKDLIPGDLVFFKTSSEGISHVGLYIGEGNMIHASSGHRKVMITNINQSSYYSSRYATARRIIK